MVVFLAVVCASHKASATEEVIVPADMPENCSRGDDGIVTCDGLTKDEFLRPVRLVLGGLLLWRWRRR